MNRNILHVALGVLTGMVNGEIQKGTDENEDKELPMPEKFNDYLISSFYKINLGLL